MMFAGGMGETWFADPADMAGWAERAPVGETFIYAQAPALPSKSRVAVAAAELHQRGLVGLNLRREGGRLTYLLRRVRQRIDKRAPVPAKAMNGGDARLYRLLSDIAGAGRTCPVNRELARRAGLRDGKQVSYHLTRLVELGKIRRRVADSRRFITIVAGGDEIEGPAQ